MVEELLARFSDFELDGPDSKGCGPTSTPG